MKNMVDTSRQSGITSSRDYLFVGKFDLRSKKTLEVETQHTRNGRMISFFLL
jgi:hypothetical protein